MPGGPSLTPRSCLGAHLLLMNLYRRKTEAQRKGLARGPQRVEGQHQEAGGPRLKQVCPWSYCVPLQPGLSEGPLHTRPGDLVTEQVLRSGAWMVPGTQ